MEFSENTKTSAHKEESRPSLIERFAQAAWDYLSNLLKEDPNDKRPVSCCEKSLDWEIIEGDHYTGTYSRCDSCKSEYHQKLPSNAFISDHRPKLYVGKPIDDKGRMEFKHASCGKKAERLSIILEDQEGVKMKPFGLGHVPSIERILYCPSCEGVNRKYFPQHGAQDAWDYLKSLRRSKGEDKK